MLQYDKPTVCLIYILDCLIYIGKPDLYPLLLTVTSQKWVTGEKALLGPINMVFTATFTTPKWLPVIPNLFHTSLQQGHLDYEHCPQTGQQV